MPFPVFFIAITAGFVAIRCRMYLRLLNVRENSLAPVADARRYRPMLRLLGDEDLGFVPDPALRRKLRSDRRRLFRQYVRWLAKDYGRLLARVRLLMIHSETDRPDLARLLMRNQILFVLALWRIDGALWLHSMGVQRINFSELFGALDSLRIQVRGLAENTTWGA